MPPEETAPPAVPVPPPAAPVVAPPAPAAPPAPSAAAPPSAPAVPPVAPAAPAGAPPADEPTWFKPRLEQAKRAGATDVLKQLGVATEAEAKALIDSAKAKTEAEKTELQKAQDKVKTLEPQALRLVELEKTVKARSDVELAQLTEAQKAAVIAIAGDDPARLLTTIDTLRATWTAPPAPVVTTPVVAPVTPAPAPAPPVVPANTSPPPVAPGGAPNTSPPDYKAEYTRLKESNPHRAALYLNEHAEKIYPRQ